MTHAYQWAYSLDMETETATAPTPTATTIDPGPRPSNPSISFDRSCFVQTGVKTEYVIGFGGHRYPNVYSDEETAKKDSARFNRPYWTRTSPIMTRIKWTAAD